MKIISVFAILMAILFVVGCDYDPNKYDLNKSLNQTDPDMYQNITINPAIKNITWTPPNITGNKTINGTKINTSVKVNNTRPPNIVIPPKTKPTKPGYIPQKVNFTTNKSKNT